MIKTITITAHNRSAPLKIMLETLSKNDTDGWEVVASVEPTSVRDEIVDLIKSYFPHAILLLPEKKKGVRDNPFYVLSHVFDEMKSDINIYLEDDIRISEDVCDLAEWYQESCEQHECLCLCNHNSFGSMDGKEEVIIETSGSHFSALGIIMNRKNWDETFKPGWFLDGRGWDWSIKGSLGETKKSILLPLISRSTHTAPIGTHCNQKIHDECRYDQIKVCDKMPQKYRLKMRPSLNIKTNNSYPDGVPYTSIVIATYNKASYLERTLQSIRDQNVSFPYEIIVVNDGSTDSTFDVCKRYGIKYAWIDGGPYRNPSVARNVGYRMARGEVIIAQSDDVIHVTQDSVELLTTELSEGEFLISTVYDYDLEKGVKKSEYTGRGVKRPLFFLGSLLKKDLYRIGGNDEDFKSPGYDDTWFADCLIQGIGLEPRYMSDAGEKAVVGHHQSHPRPRGLAGLVKPSEQVYLKKLKEGIFMSSGGPWFIEGVK